jgi:type IV pilus assembly protein PilN
MSYSIDINFLRDRKLDTPGRTTLLRQQQQTPMSERIPMIIGLVVGVALVAASGGALLVLNQQKAQMEQEIAELDTEIKILQGETEEIKAIQAQIEQVQQQTTDLVSVFSTIKPWSAILNEITRLIPPSVQLESISQSGNKTITITGTAKTYDDVNDFLLTLQKSRFFNSDNIKLVSANTTESKNELAFSQTPGEQPIVEFPSVVSYNITTELSEIPASELIRELNTNGAIGLVTRLRNLERKGAIQQ